MSSCQVIYRQKHSVYVKGHQNNSQTTRILPRRDRAPSFEINDGDLIVRCSVNLSDVRATCQTIFQLVRCYGDLSDAMATCQTICRHRVRCYI